MHNSSFVQEFVKPRLAELNAQKELEQKQAQMAEQKQVRVRLRKMTVR